MAPELENLKSAGDNKTPSAYNTIPQRIGNWKLERGGYSSLEIVGVVARAGGGTGSICPWNLTQGKK